MEIKVMTNNTEMVVAPVGRLDTNTAPELEKELGAMPEAISSLIFDFEKLRYISSAGLRVLLNMQKKFNAQKGKMIIKHANELIMEVLRQQDSWTFSPLKTIDLSKNIRNGEISDGH